MSKLPSPFQSFENLQEGVTADTLEEYKKAISNLIKNPILLDEQKKDSLAAMAVNVLPYPPISEEAQELIQQGVICLLGEGAAPHHPRYTAPFFEKILENGSEFLELKPAENLFDATASLITAYNYSPNGGAPVFVGRLDELLEPYYDTVDEDTAYQLIRSFWMLVDRLHPSAFVHANIGPEETRIGSLLLKVDQELKPMTNVTLRYDPDITTERFALKAVETALLNTKPYFLNHQMMVNDWGEDYAVASCYNGMRLGGGIHTLVRVNLKKAAELSDGSEDDLLNRVMPYIGKYWMEVIESRVNHLVEEVGWYDSGFWIEEGLLDKEKFSAYAAIFGLAEAVNHVMSISGRNGDTYGRSEEANRLAKKLTDKAYQIIKESPIKYCDGTHGIACYHAQVGIMEDVEVSPATRIPSGEEPELFTHLRAEAPNHEWLLGGVSTILEFDQTAAQNPSAVLDIIQGAFKEGTRNLSIGSANSEFVRVTGYLIRRADLEAAKQEKSLRHSSSFVGSAFMETKPNHLHRITRKV